MSDSRSKRRIQRFRDYWRGMQQNPHRPAPDDPACRWVKISCNECPIVWPGKYCCLNNGLIGQFYSTLNAGNLVDAARIAGKIAQLPVKEEG